jgi:CubicO group peptidase (beta-lactamase class C family)
VFQSASVGKQFTAAEILLLVQDGTLALEDPISKYLRDAPEEWSKITVRHLLTHTSGIPDYGEDSTWLDSRRDYSEDELLRVISAHPLLRQPGEEWIYSNAGYTLLGMIIRTVTGEHWGEFLKKRVFGPLGMETARVISEEDLVPNRAAGYRLVDGELKNQEWVAPSLNTVAEGSLYFTVLDLAKWDAALDREDLLSKASKEQMWSAVRLNDGSTASHGLGWFLQEEPGRRAMECDGAWQGFRSYIGRFPDASLTVIVLANSSAVQPILVGHKIAALRRPALAPPARSAIQLPSETLAEYVGAYRLPTGEVFRLSRTESGLKVEMGPRVAELVPEAKDVFFAPTAPDSRLVFVRDKTGAVRWVQPRRVPSWPARAAKVDQ